MLTIRLTKAILIAHVNVISTNSINIFFPLLDQKKKVRQFLITSTRFNGNFISNASNLLRIRNVSVVVVYGYGLKNQGGGVGCLDSCLSDGSRLPLGPKKPTDQWAIGCFPLGIKQPRLEVAQYVY
jgi:hypothetical protein